MSTDASLLQLMRLVSPALPVGGFAYSQGQEQAIDSGIITDANGVKAWLQGVLTHGMAYLDVPLLYRLYQSAPLDDGETQVFSTWNARVLACRETAELRLEELQMGKALWRLLRSLEVPLPDIREPTWLAAFALAAKSWGVSSVNCCQGFLWNWLENQLVVAAKIVPIGQTDVQRIYDQLMPHLLEAVTTGVPLKDDEIGGSLPGLAMASMMHETQYSRLFRS